MTRVKKHATLRSLFEFKRNRPSISIDEVEPAENIFKRFATGAMSFGSISMGSTYYIGHCDEPSWVEKVIPVKVEKMKEDMNHCQMVILCAVLLNKWLSASFGVTSLLSH